MNSRRTLTVMLAAALVMGAFAPAPKPAEAALAGGNLSFSVNGPFGHDEYVGGMGLTLSGSFNVAGKRNIWVEAHLNRPGDEWMVVPGFEGETRADGSFDLPFQAPSMFGISYRVAGTGGHATSGVTFDAKSQELEIWVAGDNRNDPEDLGYPVANQDFTITADAQPEFLIRRIDLEGSPILEGRTLTLQRKLTSTTWETLETTTVGSNGRGYFEDLNQPEGTVTYRVIAEDWTENGSSVGWISSFPLAVDARHPSDPEPDPVSGPDIPPNPYGGGEPKAASATASAKYGWYPMYYDFAWERGEDLDSPPKRGTRMRGVWLPTIEGLGRVSKHNGGLRFDSGRLKKHGIGDFGTTRVTLVGNASKYGRWETRLRMRTYETKDDNYEVIVELVPEHAADFNCGRNNILVARYQGTGGSLNFGVNAGDTKWRRTVKAGNLIDNIPALGVEVSKSHITWFLNAKPIGTVKNADAVSDVPLTLRISLVATSNHEHDNTVVYSDWQRAFPLSSGRQVKNAHSLKRSDLSSCPE